jgi:methanethiol oxidase
MRPTSLYDSPAQAARAPAEEFLYLACLHGGTGVDRPDFVAVVDAEDGRIVHETPMPNVGDELHHFGWNRCSSAWENGGERPPMNYDFWYQPRKNALISSEFGEPNAYEKGFDIEDVGAGRYGRRLHFWNLAERRLEQTIDLGEQGLVPLEVRWLHDPESDSGFVGATLSSNIFRFHRSNGSFRAEPVIEVDNRRSTAGHCPAGGRDLNGGPQMIQLSLDGRRLYVTNSLYSTWDNQFYPGLRSWLIRVNCSPDGGMEVDPDFFVDFHDRPAGPARAHEVRLQGGDCTTEIFP